MRRVLRGPAGAGDHLSTLAREIFAQMIAMGGGLIYDASASGSYRERTDAELDALVSYAVRAAAACDREAKPALPPMSAHARAVDSLVSRIFR